MLTAQLSGKQPSRPLAKWDRFRKSFKEHQGPRLPGAHLDFGVGATLQRIQGKKFVGATPPDNRCRKWEVGTLPTFKSETASVERKQNLDHGRCFKRTPPQPQNNFASPLQGWNTVRDTPHCPSCPSLNPLEFTPPTYYLGHKFRDLCISHGNWIHQRAKNGGF